MPAGTLFGLHTRCHQTIQHFSEHLTARCKQQDSYCRALEQHGKAAPAVLALLEQLIGACAPLQTALGQNSQSTVAAVRQLAQYVGHHYLQTFCSAEQKTDSNVKHQHNPGAAGHKADSSTSTVNTDSSNAPSQVQPAVSDRSDAEESADSERKLQELMAALARRAGGAPWCVGLLQPTVMQMPKLLPPLLSQVGEMYVWHMTHVGWCIYGASGRLR